MACKILKQKIHDTLRGGYFRSERADIVQVLSEGELDRISRIVAINPEEIKIYT